MWILSLSATACTPASQTAARAPEGMVRVRDCDGPALSLDASLAAKLPPRRGRMDPDGEWAAWAEKVPGGFAGILYLERTPTLMLTDTTKAEEAKRALAPYFTEFPLPSAQVRQARWDFSQLVDWFVYLEERTPLWGVPGLVSGDKNERTNRIHFGVTSEAARDELLRTLARIDLPCDLIVVEMDGPITIDDQ